MLFARSNEIDDDTTELQEKFNLTEAEADNVVEWCREQDDLDSAVEEKLYSYFMDSGEMPYGVAKARTGDPQIWIREQVEQFVN